VHIRAVRLTAPTSDASARGAITTVTRVTFALSPSFTATRRSQTARCRSRSRPITKTQSEQSQATSHEPGPFAAATV
jgi:hypothetical protein